MVVSKFFMKRVLFVFHSPGKNKKEYMRAKYVKRLVLSRQILFKARVLTVDISMAK